MSFQSKLILITTIQTQSVYLSLQKYDKSSIRQVELLFLILINKL